jgi:hypothetical protein
MELASPSIRLKPTGHNRRVGGTRRGKRGANLDKHKSPTRSHLFTVRLWVEESAESGPHWYGKLQDMEDGHTAYFEDLQMLLAVLQGFLMEVPAAPARTSPPAGEL